jgi:hypothetical protein
MKFCFFITLVLIGFCSSAQITKIMGKVTDAKTGEAMPFVNITLRNTKVGCITDMNGNYKIETSVSSDSLIASYLGYQRKTVKIYNGKFQTINIQLKSSSLELSEVTVSTKKRQRTKDELALMLLDKIMENKDQNNIEKLSAFEYETYNKIQFDMNNITDEFKNRRVMKPFKFIFDYVDTSTVNGTVFLPVFIIESLSDFYYKTSPKTEREVIRATRASGIQNESLNEFMGNMYLKVNIYNNYIDIFGKGFVSPVAGLGRLYYRYYLLDSAFIDNNWCYHMAYLPKIKQDYTFNGDFWVTDTTFAIKKINIKIDKNVNLNFVNNFEITQEFAFVDTTIWMLSKEEMVIDFNLFENPNQAMGFFGRKTTTYRNHKVNKPREDQFYQSTTNIIVQKDADKKDDKYWLESRHEELNDKEKQIYAMVDTIKDLPAFRTYYDIINMFVTYYYVWGNFELGPYFTAFSFNDVEGPRFRVGARTSNAFSTKLMIEGYTAYGVKDERFKCGGNFIYLYNKNPRRGFGAEFKHDLELLGQSVNAFREDNILSSVLRRNPNIKLNMVDEYKAHYEHEWFQGFSNTFRLTYRDQQPVSGIDRFRYVRNNDTISTSSFVTTDISIGMRFAYDEKFVMGEFERISLGTTYPELDVIYTYGIPNLLHSDFEYHKLEFNVYDWFNTYPVGYSKYIITAGKVFGTLPYPLLKLHEGNETYSFDPFSFNLMNYYEFVSDQYLSVYYSHHFDGFFLNKFPLLRRLKWREVAWAKGVVGSLENKNRQMMTLPETLYTLDRSTGFTNLKPYMEAGAGIENIFRLLRFDVVWRMTYLDHPNISRLGFRFSLQVKF